MILRFGIWTMFFCAVAEAPANDIAFFYAVEADWHALKKEATVIREPVNIGQHSIETVSLGKHKIYAVKMGSGAVETAGSAATLLSRFRCDLAISVGPVGALSDDLEIGKWYRVSSIVAYQRGSSTRGGFQIKQGSILKPEQVAFSKLPVLLQDSKPITVASGEVFVASDLYRQELRTTSHADAVDMNLFGLLSVCLEYHLPSIHWRVVSDKANDNAVEDFRQFTQKYDGAGGRAIADAIRNLPGDPNSPDSYPQLQKLLKPTTTHDQIDSH